VPERPAAVPARVPARLRDLVLVYVGVGGALLVVSAVAASTRPVAGHTLEQATRLLLGLGAIALSDLPFVRLRFGHTQESFALGLAAVVVAFALLPWPWVVLAQGATSAVGHSQRTKSFLKAAFNTANDILFVAVAAAVALALSTAGDLAPATSRASLLAVSVGVLVGNTLGNAGTALVVATAQQLRVREVLERGLGFRMLVSLSSCALGAVVVILAVESPLTLVAIPVIVGLLVLVQRATLRDEEEDGVWRQLEDAGRELKTLSERELVPRAVTRTAALTRCDRVELLLRIHDEPGQVVAYRGGLRGVETEQVEHGPLRTISAEQRPEPRRSDTGDTVLEVGLAGPAGPLGTLRVVFAGEIEVREREVQVLTTYSRTVASTLLNARLYADAVAEAELKAWQAGHDSLTGLVNRAGLMDLAGELDAAAAAGEVYAMLVLDLDHFKQVNDTLGHDSGDRLLQHVASVLADRVRRGDIAARLEGDAFALLVRRLPEESTVEAIAADVLRCVSDPVEHEELRLSLEATIGYAVAPADADGLALLLKRAEMVMVQAKTSPGSARRWQADRDDRSRDRLALSADLRAGLAAGDELVLHYQPQVDLVTGGVRSVEVLARWQHPTRGLLMPDEFVPIAERSGLSRPFTLAVLDGAVAEAAAWRSLGLGDGEVAVAVNLSARNLLDRDLPSDVAVALARHGLPARQLVLEITETVAMSELEVVSDVLARLRSLGVQLSVDDFGTGYSSLKFLQAIAVNEIKIDREFVLGMLTNEQDAAIVRATVELGHGLGLRVVAEGVERDEHLEALSALGCDAAQGYHVARPMPAEVLRELLLPARGTVVPLRAARRRRGTA